VIQITLRQLKKISLMWGKLVAGVEQGGKLKSISSAVKAVPIQTPGSSATARAGWLSAGPHGMERFMMGGSWRLTG
jgi:hypothetical protein